MHIWNCDDPHEFLETTPRPLEICVFLRSICVVGLIFDIVNAPRYCVHILTAFINKPYDYKIQNEYFQQHKST